MNENICPSCGHNFEEVRKTEQMIRDQYDKEIERLNAELILAKKIAYLAYRWLGYFNWQTWTLHHDEINKFINDWKPDEVR